MGRRVGARIWIVKTYGGFSGAWDGGMDIRSQDAFAWVWRRGFGDDARYWRKCSLSDIIPLELNTINEIS